MIAFQLGTIIPVIFSRLKIKQCSPLLYRGILRISLRIHRDFGGKFKTNAIELKTIKA